MYFKRLEIIGFKSFPDKTVFNFDPGITAVVGPNGCGKSNIADSIKWVLGEQAARALRGGDMQDVIFNGTDTRPALNMAEATLILSNESKRLPIEFDEVAITRRLFRSGESEYLINKSVVRLKDIQELLMGTGIGLESYSFIEQGKIDAILSSRPDERRAVFDEASGITKYKSKKKETLRKLEQTEENLLRVGDIIAEVKRQIDSIARQAKKAQRYKEEFERLKEAETALSIYEYDGLEKEKINLRNELSELNDKKLECESAIREIDKAIENERRCLSLLQDSIKEKTATSIKTSGIIDKNKTQILTMQEWLKQLDSQTADIISEIAGIKDRIANIKDTVNTMQDASFKLVDEEIKKKEIELSATESSSSEATSKIVDLQESIKRLKALLFENAAKQAGIKNEMADINTSLAGIHARVKRLDAEHAKVSQELAEAETALTQNQHEPAGAVSNNIKSIIDRNISALFDGIAKFVHIQPDSKPQLLSYLYEFLRNIVNEALAMFGLGALALKQEEEKLKKELEILEFERDEAKDENTELRAKLDTLNSEASILEAEKLNTENLISQSEDAIQELLKKREGFIIEVASVKAQIQSLKDRGLSQATQIQTLNQDLTDAQTGLDSKSSQLQGLTNRKTELNLQISILNNQIAELTGQKQENDIEVSRLEEEQSNRSSALSNMEAEHRNLSQNIEILHQEIFGYETKLSDISYKQKTIVDRVLMEYKTDIMGIEHIAESIEPETLRVEISALKEKLERLGPVNLAAIEEEKALNERYLFLISQQEDLLKAKESLKEAIAKINKTTKELFAKTFENVRKEFQHFFVRLFGGGEADLVLLDESDILECGIEVIARPPGKKSQNVGLLSGGEKALVAIALLFALFKVNPSPFCVLDEIDAPLDEANTDRFINVLDEFVKLSQFIVITHSKKTITKTDVMYGITMEESGVSKVVSVKLKERQAETVTAPAV